METKTAVAPKPLNLKELSKKPELLAGGHRLCAGCGASIIIRQMLLASEHPVVVSNATGCLEVATTIFPYSSWRVPWIHNAFENSAATMSGVESMYRSLKKQGKIPPEQEIRFLALGGDGGTYDIGIQSLSGALERGHRMLYVCYNNEGYMNTGIQRSSATPKGTDTTTSPVGKYAPSGKVQWRKDLTGIVAAHNIPYVAQAAPSHWQDLMQKTRKAFAANGPSFMNVLSSCMRGWRHEANETVAVTKAGVDSCYWPLYEIIDGKWKLNYKPKQKIPVAEYLKPQGRFKHLFRPENKEVMEEIQDWVDKEWEKLLIRCGEK